MPLLTMKVCLQDFLVEKKTAKQYNVTNKYVSLLRILTIFINNDMIGSKTKDSFITEMQVISTQYYSSTFLYSDYIEGERSYMDTTLEIRK